MGLKNKVNLWLGIKVDNSQLKDGLKKSQKRVSSFSKSMSKLGGVIAGAFAIRAIVNFGKELVNLGGQAQGVRKAFDKLEMPGLLDDLRKATSGTVDDLQLMKKAVQARNFKIPLEQLATYFEFAKKRATQTGESVDYLVESIITGIGRKSVMIMDNLGISAAELRDEVKKVGDFGLAAGQIIERELKNMGTVADTTKDSVTQLSTAWTNFKINLGEAAVAGGGLAILVGHMSDFVKLMGDFMMYGQWLGQLKFLSGYAGDESRATGKSEAGAGIKKAKGAYKPSVGIDKDTFMKAYLKQQSNIADYYLKDIEDRFREAYEAHDNELGTSLAQTYAHWQGYKQEIDKALGSLTKISDKSTEFGEKLISMTPKSSQGLWWEAYFGTAVLSGNVDKMIEFLNRLENYKPPKLELLDADYATPLLPLRGDNAMLREMVAMDAHTEELTDSFDTLANAGQSAFGEIGSAVQSLIPDMDKLTSMLLNIVLRLGMAFATGGGSAGLGLLASVIPSFASGGIATGPQLAMVGDNPGHKEAIIPSEMFGAMNSNVNVNVTGKIRGTDLYLVQKKYAEKLDNYT